MVSAVVATARYAPSLEKARRVIVAAGGRGCGRGMAPREQSKGARCPAGEAEEEVGGGLQS